MVDINGSKRIQRLGDANGSLSSRPVAIEQEEDGGGSGEPVDVGFEELSTKESNGVWRSCLCYPYGSPRAFDDNDAPMAKWLCTMSIIEHMSFWKVFGEAPLTETINLFYKKLTATVAEGIALEVMQPNGNGIFEKERARGGSCFKAQGCIGRDLLFIL